MRVRSVSQPKSPFVRVVVVAPQDPAVETAVERLQQALKHVGMTVSVERPNHNYKPEKILADAAGPGVLLLADGAPGAAAWQRAVKLDSWPVHDGYRLESFRRIRQDQDEASWLVIASREVRGLLYGCLSLADEIVRQLLLPAEMHVRSQPHFPVRGWESQLEDFWCRWMGGSPDWFSNERYLTYLRDALSRAPQYRINTFILMGRGDQGEVHTFVNYAGWDKLRQRQSVEAHQRTRQQAEVLESLARDASRFGVRLFLWDHELQLPQEFADLYPEVRGQGVLVCPSSPLVWHLLEDKYNEFFCQVPSLAGIVLVFSETQFNILGGSPCGCNRCCHRTGADFVRQIVTTARDACERHGKQLIVRDFGHGWKQIDTILAAIRSIQPPDSFTVMSKMVPWDFFGLQLPPHPTTAALSERPRILEDTVGGEFRGKTHTVCLPADYYHKHLSHAAAHGSHGAVFRLDHSAYPRSVFETPNEFNVWITGQLLWAPQQALDELWRQWTSQRYGEAAAPQVAKALQLSADVWEHSTNSFGFYCTSAHAHIAPFFRGAYNAYSNLMDTAPLLTRFSPEKEQQLQRLLNPDRDTLDEVVAERQQAVQWAFESLAALEKAKPDLDAKTYGELSYYLCLQSEAARLWRELGDLFVTGLAILPSEGLPLDLMERQRTATERALRQGQNIEQKFGRGHWPVAPDADGRGTRLERAIVGLWAEWLDRLLGLEPLPLGTWQARAPRTDVERLYLALLESASGLGPSEVSMTSSPGIAKLRFEGTSLVVESTIPSPTLSHPKGGKLVQLALPVAMTVQGPELDGSQACQLRIQADKKGLQVERVPEPPWIKWLHRRRLPPDEAESMMTRFVDRRLQPLPLPESRQAWLAGREALRRQLLQILGLDDLLPPKWDLKIQPKGVLHRQGYRIEKISFESYPGMAVPALLYVPEGITGRLPGLVSIAGHVYGDGKAADFLQQRNVNLALRGCVVLAYDYINCGERNTGPDPRHGKPYGGGNDHGICSFSFSGRTPTGLEVLDAMRALDMLASRSEVDAERLGFTGESGGGNSTYWIAALDPRVKLAAPVSSVTTFDYWIRHDRNWDWHQRPFGIRRRADIGTLLALHAPQPLLVISSLRGTDNQEFPLEEAEKSVDWVQHIYHLLNASEAIAHIESTSGHGYQEDKRRHLYQWVERWLQPPFPKGDIELPAKIETFEELQCGLPPDNHTLRDIYAEWLKLLPRTSAQPNASSQKALRRFLRQRLGFPDSLPRLVVEKIEREEQDSWFAEFWLFQPEPDIRLPGVLLGRKDAAGAIVLVPGRDEEAMARALKAGYWVFSFDPRGTGEMSDGGGHVRNWAWFMGRPWSGMWALDILQAVRFCRGKFPDSAVVVEAQNRFGWQTLLAAAARPNLIPSGVVQVSLSTLHQQLRDHGDAALADVPGLLEHLDLAQIRALCRKIEVKIKP